MIHKKGLLYQNKPWRISRSTMARSGQVILWYISSTFGTTCLALYGQRLVFFATPGLFCAQQNKSEFWFHYHTHTHTHTNTFNGPLSGTTQVSRYQKDKTNLDYTEARDSEWQWHQLVHMQVCTVLQTDNHASTPPLSFYRPDALPDAQPTALKASLIS